MSSKLKGSPSGQKEGKSHCPVVIGSEGSIVILPAPTAVLSLPLPLQSVQN